MSTSKALHEGSAATGLMFLHGLESSGQGDKAQLLRTRLPGLIAPDFSGPIEQRMRQLEPVVASFPRWRLIGSSFGGLMAALWTCAHPDRVTRLVLLAPALHHEVFAERVVEPVDVPTVIVHGTRDEVVPREPVLAIAKRVFPDLTVHVVDDDHRLRETSRSLDWPALLGVNLPA